MTTLNKDSVKRLLEDVFSKESLFLFDDPGLGSITGKPVMAVASAEDPFFSRFKAIIGPFHLTPAEVLERHRPGARAVSVISWYLPTAESIRRANRKEDRYPAREWSFHRTFGGHMMDRICLGLVQALTVRGYKAAVPRFDPDNRVRRDEKAGWTSCWSERHAAFTAGLGTFGLSGGLITQDGIAHRLGSVVTDLPLEVDQRPYGDDPLGWCLGREEGECGVCIRRCPVGSVGSSLEARNKDLCEYHDGTIIPEHCGPLLDFTGEFGCGLCQTAVPCEFRKP